MKQGREKTTDLTDAAEIERIRKLEGADIKESLEIGREGVAGLENKWPDFDPEGEEFKLTMLEFFEQCKGLHVEVMRAIAVGLGIEQNWFDSFCNGGDNTLRLLHYPEVDAEVFKNNKNSVRAGAHTDYGKSCFEAVAALERRTSTHSAPHHQAPSRSSSRTTAAAYRSSARTTLTSTRPRSRTPSLSMQAICLRGGRMTASRAPSTA